MARYKPKKVTWVEPAARIPQKRPHPYVVTPDLDPAEAERLAPHLEPGSLWTVTCDLTLDGGYSPQYYRQHEFPYLQRASYYGLPTATSGSLAVYVGITRVEEAQRDREMRVPRHTFLIGGSRYLVADLTLLQPVS